SPSSPPRASALLRGTPDDEVQIAGDCFEQLSLRRFDEEVIARQNVQRKTRIGLLPPGNHALGGLFVVGLATVRTNVSFQRTVRLILVELNHLKVRAQHRYQEIHQLGILEYLGRSSRHALQVGDEFISRQIECERIVVGDLRSPSSRYEQSPRFE